VATWKKQRGFDQLEMVVLSLRSTHQVADLMEVIRQGIPVDMDSAAQDAANQMQNVLGSVYNIENLNTSAFPTSTGKQAHLASEKLKDRPDNVTFFRFSYNLDPSSMDKRIKQKPTFFSFCLRLPQHKYYKKEGTVKEIFSPATKQKPGKSKMTGLVGKVLKVNLFGSPAETEEECSSPNDDHKDDSVVTLTARTPKMDALFSSGSNVSIGYFGGLGFTYNQNKFTRYLVRTQC